MKTIKNIIKVFGAMTIGIALVNCTPSPKLRQPHEGAKSWSAQKVDEEVVAVNAEDFAKLDLAKFEALADKPETDQLGSVVVPLGQFILNNAFISAPQNRNRKTAWATEILFKSLYRILKNEKALSAEEKKIWQAKFENVLLAGCNVDFSRGCINANYLGRNAWAAKILLAIAIEQDADLDNEIKKAGSASNCIENSETCRYLTQLRYRRLAMVFSLRKGEGRDEEASFAFIKYIRPLNALINKGGDIGYLNATYLNIFEMLISKFEAKDVNPTEFRAFVESFNPWTFSSKKSNTFRFGSKAIFNLAASCCLYKDKSKTQISDAIKEAIGESQIDSSSEGKSFKQLVDSMRVAKIRGNKTEGKVDVMTSMGMQKEAAELMSLDSDFYNEYFYVIDRLFNGHIDSSEAMRILEQLSPERTDKYFLKTIQVYLKVQLLAMTVETIDFMNTKIYQTGLSSDLIFSEALNVSRDISMKWMRMQERLDILESFAGGFYNRMATPPKEFEITSKLLKSAKRNTHYISVYPNMIGLSYFLAKNQGEIKARSWWGEEFSIDPTTVVTLLIDGNIQKPWFKFSSDPELLSREKMFYAFYYALKTQALDIFSVEEKKGGESDRAKFFELTLGKYLEDDKRALNDLNLKLESIILKPYASSTEPVCNYELGKSKTTFPIRLNLDELTTTTFTSFGPSGVAAESRAILTGDIAKMIQSSYQDLEPKLIFANSIITMVEQHMLESGEIKDLNAAHAELKNVRAIVKDIKDRQKQLMTKFFRYRKDMFACSKQLYIVELARYYRIYIEEKKYLERAYQAMEEAEKAAWAPQAVASINKKYFSSYKLRFDGIVAEGKTFRMSKVDYLTRVKRYIESDIFANPTLEEQKRLGPLFKTAYRPRKISVDDPPNIEIHDLVANANQTYHHINFTSGAKEAFVNEGLKELDGNAGSYAEYGKQADQLEFFKSYLDTLTYAYLLGDIETNGEEYGACKGVSCETFHDRVTADELLDIFKQTVELIDLTEFDVEIGRVLGETGRMGNGELSKFLVETGSLNAVPLLRYMMEKVYREAGLTNDTRGILKSGQNLSDMLTSEGVIIFDPGVPFKNALYSQFGQPINRILTQTKNFFSSASELESKPEWKALLDTKIRLENGKVITIQGSSGRDPVTVVDRQMQGNLNYWLQEYVRRTDNKFKSREALK